MKLPVAVAVPDPRVEAAIVDGLARERGVAVVRRCVDLADLLATASSGQIRAALVAADLRRLDLDALTRLAAAGVAIVGVTPAADEEADRRLRMLGVEHVLPDDTDAGRVATALRAAAEQGPGTPARSVAVRRLHAVDLDAVLPDLRAPDPGTGRIVAVWGPTGAPGRTTVALGVAAELAASGEVVLLVDADTYGGSVAQHLGLLDESSGLLAVTRLANTGMLDVPALEGLARRVAPRLSVLTGLTRADRWPEIRAGSVEVVLDCARRAAGVTVVDCGFCVEQDEELVYDHAVARRNGPTLAALSAADHVVAVGGADPVSLQRLVRGLSDLADAVPGVAPDVVVNQLRPSIAKGRAQREISATLQRFAGVTPVAYIPQDVSAYDAALGRGRLLVEAAPSSPAARALRGLAQHLRGRPARRGLLRRH